MKIWFPALLLLLYFTLAASIGGGLAADHLPEGLRTDTIATRDGLSSSSVSTILQDDEGIIWIGTQAGLNRYDGIEFTLFENDPFDERSVSHNLIQTMYLDTDGTLWVGTYGGLNRYDRDSGTFSRFVHDSEDPTSLSNDVVVSIVRDGAGALWIGTLNGLNRIDSESGGFIRYSPGGGDDALPDKVIRSLAVDSEGTLWIGSYGGLSRYNPDNDNFTTWNADPADGRELPSPYVMSIVPDRDRSDRFWVGTWGGGLSLFDREAGVIRNYDLPDERVYALLRDGRQRLWIGTWGGGLMLLDPVDGELVHYPGREGGTGGIDHQVVYSLFEDESGVIWIGTNGGGIHTFADWENQYRFLVSDTEDPTGIAAGKVECFWEDPDGTLWIGVYSGGLNRFNPVSGAITRYSYDPERGDSLSNDIVNAVFRDSRGDLWIGTNEGLNRYTAESDSFERLLADGSEQTPPEDTIFEITEDSAGRLWFGTNSAGAVRYDPQSGIFTAFGYDENDPASLSDNLVRSIIEDESGAIWIGTNSGLNRLQSDDSGFTRYQHDPGRPGSLSSSNIRALFEDSQGVLWIATSGGGLNWYDPETDGFSYISRRDGLLSNHIIAVAERRPGELWLTSNLGVTVYRTIEGTSTTIDVSDGLLDGELTSGLLVDSRGRVYLGGINGVTIIDEPVFEGGGYTPRLRLKNLEILGLTRSIERDGEEYRELRLPHNQNTLLFEFAVLDYASPERNQYAYKLRGFDTDWHYSGSTNSARYTNLDPGRYTLLVSGAGSRGNWNREGIVVPIRILPPWYLTTPAWGLYGVLSVLAMLLLLQIFQRRERQLARQFSLEREINRELEEKVRERTGEIEAARRTAEEASRAKSIFLANMSHEIRTPLNGIFGMLSLLSSSSLDAKQREYIAHSRRAAENLNYLVTDLLDFESIEAGSLKIQTLPFSWREMLEEVRSLFAPQAREKGLRLDTEIDLDGAPDRVVGDPARVNQILTNLAANAIKYTERGSVVLQLSSPGPAAGDGTYPFRLRVRDTGVGIPREKQEEIFASFTRLDSGYAGRSRGVGLGLAIVHRLVDAFGGRIGVESTPGAGSTFTVDLVFPAAPPIEGGAAEIEETKDVEPCTILLCEDEAVNRLYLETWLNERGYRVVGVPDGEQALEAFEQGLAEQRFCVVLMDLGLPGRDGLTTAAAMRELEREAGTERVPILALTAHTYEEDIERCRAAGMDDFVAKPVDERLLLARLRAWLS